jgi:hypothetical protein
MLRREQRIMIKVDQTKLHDPDNGVRGNCYAACIASLLELPLEDVPAFEDMYNSGKEKWKWFGIFLKFLQGKGYEFHGTGKPSQIRDPYFARGVDGYVMAYGESPRDSKVTHAVIYKDGEMVHDPHPSRDGIVKLHGFDMVEPIEEMVR